MVKGKEGKDGKELKEETPINNFPTRPSLPSPSINNLMIPPGHKRSVLP
jgi:hypothetical protein